MSKKPTYYDFDDIEVIADGKRIKLKKENGIPIPVSNSIDECGICFNREFPLYKHDGFNIYLCVECMSEAIYEFIRNQFSCEEE